MPPKRKPSLGTKPAAARRKQISRENESAAERTSRLAYQRARSRASTETESDMEREARLAGKKARTKASRDNENAIQRDARLSDKRARTTASRENAVAAHRQTRLAIERHRIAASRTSTFQIHLKSMAFEYCPNINYQDHPIIQIGAMDTVCKYCRALLWKGEPPGLCCSNGKVQLPALPNPPAIFKHLMAGQSADSKHFLGNMRKYNSCFQMTSFGATKLVTQAGFMPTFKVQGQIYHTVGSLLPSAGNVPKFLQIYFMGDADAEAHQRFSALPSTRLHIILQLQQFLHENHSYVGLFKTALEMMPTDDYKVIIKADKVPLGEHSRRYNAPTVDDVAIVIGGNEFGQRDIVLHKRNNSLQRVAETHRSYDALQYPLIFWQGTDGYYFGIPLINPSNGMALPNKKVSAMDFYAYRIMSRLNEENHILDCRQLFNQFMVDMYAKIETERLLYIRLNQKKLRCEEYIHLRDAVLNDGDTNQIGKMLILPSSFTGSPRHMHEYTQDAMSYVRKYGRPDLFITFTSNPTWPEITAELLPGQKPFDRHDLIARVFKLKLNKMRHVLTTSAIFGDVQCWMLSVEWQKRGLPHSHILVWLKDKIRSTAIDKIIHAEIPNPDADPVLFEVVTKHMLHGPCGLLNAYSPCMANGKCTKHFPRQLLQDTQTADDGYPQYRRRSPLDGGFTAKIKMRTSSGLHEIVLDNRWVVPYSPLLLKMFQAHINVEWCHSVKSIKYICKYVNKGSDQAVFELHKQGTVDEVQAFQLGRYISSNEAFWRILGMPIHERHPTVVHLQVHLENGQRVYFNSENILRKAHSPPSTSLTAFFQLCQTDDFAKTLLYCDVPQYYTWNTSRKSFQRRKQGESLAGYPGIRKSDALGRVFTVHPSNSECFYLRMLLHVVKGPTSFTYLKTVNGVVCQSFREACEQLGLLENDNQWDMALSEAAATRTPNKIRQLFAILVTTCAMSNPLLLWDKYKESMSEDILYNLRMQNPLLSVDYSPDIFNEALSLLEDSCFSMMGTSLEFYGFPTPTRAATSNQLCPEICRETSYSLSHLSDYIDKNEPLLVPEQQTAYIAILNMVASGTGGMLFLDAPGGTGKTFLINLILAKIRHQKKIAVAVASSGIAATLLTGGRTAHSAFKLPLNLAHEDAPMCNISKGSGQAKVLQQCSIIIWDECTMAHKRALEALDRTLQDLRDNRSLMGGVVVILAGDFRQTLPVIPRSTMADELNACLKASPIWKQVRKMTLSTNIRVHLTGDASAAQFAKLLLDLGNGQVPIDSHSGLITLPKNFCNLVTSIHELISNVFPDIQTNCTNHQWLCERAILAPKNDAVNKLNLHIQTLLPGDTQQYRSIDTVLEADQSVYYPVEFLNSLEPAGLPPHNLELKIGAPILLLRNLDPPKLCNGTRLCIKNLYPNIIEATILTGSATGDDVFIPRIPLIPTDLAFDFKRLQFPVRLAFAMSINKAQEQSMRIVGVNLETTCFSHGQLYVACSRVGNPNNLFILAPGGHTKNIVYAKSLQ